MLPAMPSMGFGKRAQCVMRYSALKAIAPDDGDDSTADAATSNGASSNGATSVTPDERSGTDGSAGLGMTSASGGGALQSPRRRSFTRRVLHRASLGQRGSGWKGAAEDLVAKQADESPDARVALHRRKFRRGPLPLSEVPTSIGGVYDRRRFASGEVSLLQPRVRPLTLVVTVRARPRLRQLRAFVYILILRFQLRDVSEGEGVKCEE